MEHMNVFHRIFHEDLHPLTTPQSNQEYIHYFKTKKTNEATYQNTKVPELESLQDHELKYYYFESLLKNTLKEIKRDLHQKLFTLTIDESKIAILIKNYQEYVLGYMKIMSKVDIPTNYPKGYIWIWN